MSAALLNFNIFHMDKNKEEILSNYVNSVEEPATPQTRETRGKVLNPAGIPERFRGGNAPAGSREQADQPKDHLGWQKVPVDTLPTGGLYYPEGTELFIRSAQGKEIKHWSTLDDSDLSSMDDMLNYIIERCARLRIPGAQYAGGSWKDIKDIDRFYILLSIRELTFPDAADELKIPVKENVDIPVKKEMIDFIQIPQEIMKYYSPEERCFVLRLKTGREIRMYIPSIGINEWIKRYAISKSQMRAGYDQDYLVFAPMLLGDYRKLSERAYNEAVLESESWTGKEWSLVSYVRDLIAAAVDPKLKYIDQDGQEQTTPLNIPGGVKSLFRSVSDPLSILE